MKVARLAVSMVRMLEHHVTCGEDSLATRNAGTLDS